MKKAIKYLFVFSLMAVLLNSCRKDDNPILPELIKVPTPLILKDASTDQVIDVLDPSAFSGTFTVDLFFDNDAPPEKMDIVVIKNGDKSVVKQIETVTTYPTSITITGSQLETLFNEPIALGDFFDIGANIVLNGRTYHAFPAVGVAHASGVAAQPGASTFIRYGAVCAYDPEVYQGNFVVVEDEWADYGAGDVVVLTKIDETKFSFMYPADNAQPIIIQVNPADNSVSVAKQVYGSGYGGSGWPYGPISAQSVTSIDNFVAPCDGIVSVVLDHTATVGFGSYKIVLQKQ